MTEKPEKPETLAEELHRIVQDKTPEDVVRRMKQRPPKGDGPVKHSVYRRCAPPRTAAVMFTARVDRRARSSRGRRPSIRPRIG